MSGLCLQLVPKVVKESAAAGFNYPKYNSPGQKTVTVFTRAKDEVKVCIDFQMRAFIDTNTDS